MHAVSHYSPDVLKGHAGVALPLAFLGMHQAPGPDEEKGESHDATLWGEVWQENVPGEKHSNRAPADSTPIITSVAFLSL